MSFSIDVRGTNGFNFNRPICDDGSAFEVMNVIGILQGLDLQSAGHFGISAAGAVKEKVKKGIPDLMFKMAEREMCHNISNAVSLLEKDYNTSGGWIFVSAEQKNLLFPNVSRAARYNFKPGDSPGAEFLKTIGKCLEDTDLNNWGVLKYLAVILTRFEQQLPTTMIPMLNISLTR
jgi:hypothetical protein